MRHRLQWSDRRIKTNHGCKLTSVRLSEGWVKDTLDVARALKVTYSLSRAAPFGERQGTLEVLHFRFDFAFCTKLN